MKKKIIMKIKLLWHKLLIKLKIRKPITAQEMKDKLTKSDEYLRPIDLQEKALTDFLHTAQEEFIKQRFKSKGSSVISEPPFSKQSIYKTTKQNNTNYIDSYILSETDDCYHSNNNNDDSGSDNSSSDSSSCDCSCD